MTLYGIDDQIRAVLEGSVDPTTGELLTDKDGNPIIDFEALDRLSMEKAEKMRHCIMAFKNLNADLTAIDAEIKRLTAKKKALSNKVNGLSQYIENHAENRAWSFAEGDISFRPTQVGEVDADADLESLYKHSKAFRPFIRIKYEVNRAELTKALKSGFKSKAAHLVTHPNMNIK